MSWMARTAVMIGMLAALLIGSTTEMGGARAAGAEQWYGPYYDGCMYFGDGTAFTLAECPQADGTYFYFVPGTDGTWVYGATGSYDAAGCFAVMDATTVYSYTCPTSTIVIGGQSLYPDVTISNGGSSSGLSGWQPTGIWELDQFMLESQDQNIDIWLQPRCNEVFDYTCVSY